MVRRENRKDFGEIIYIFLKIDLSKIERNLEQKSLVILDEVFWFLSFSPLIIHTFYFVFLLLLLLRLLVHFYFCLCSYFFSFKFVIFFSFAFGFFSYLYFLMKCYIQFFNKIIMCKKKKIYLIRA